MSVVIDKDDEAVRGALTRAIARLGRAPGLAALANDLSRPAADVARSLQSLADAHALLLHLGTTRPWVVHPFALSPGSCWVETASGGYWANCLYCACGIAAAMRCDAHIHTRYGGEAQAVTFHVVKDVLIDTGDIFHLSTPAARWWDNVIFACASFQPFRSRQDVDAWCERHGLPHGAVLSLPQLWNFARDWYGAYLDEPWKKRSRQEAQAVFRRHDLTGPFWDLG
ncbi:MAG: organomercurial lyase [Rhizomicrobium sp.]